MPVATELDLRNVEVIRPGDPHFKSPPANIDAEQCVLGVILYDNKALHLLPEGFNASAFYEPFHGRLFTWIASTVNAGVLADPSRLAALFANDGAFNELGGIRYLADLVDRAPPTAKVGGYAELVADCAARREMLKLAAHITNRAMAGGHDNPASEIVEDLEKGVMEIATSGRHGRAKVVSMIDAVDATLAYLDQPADEQGFRATTGLPPLDNRLGPMLGESLIVAAGRPGMGKSAFSLALATGVASPPLAAQMNGLGDQMHLLKLPQARGVFMLNEMTFSDEVRKGGGQVTRRLISNMAFHLYGEKAPTYEQIKNRTLTPDHRRMVSEAAEYVRNLPIVGKKQTNVTPTQLRSMVRRQIVRWARVGIELGMIIVDHAGLMAADSGSTRAYEQMSEIAGGLLDLSGEFEVPLVALVQLNREVERRDDKRPTIADLRDSGKWEENADVILTLYREAYYAERSAEPDEKSKPLEWAKHDAAKRSRKVEVGIPKLREGHAVGCELWCDMAHDVMRGTEPAPARGLI